MLRCRLIMVGIIAILFWIIGCLSSGLAWMVEPMIETYHCNNLIRLHVVADSNLPEDQALKLKVRDRVIQVTEPLLLNVEDPVVAEEILRSNLALLENAARQVLDEQGRDLEVKVSLEQFNFPEALYPFGVLPAGEYKGLKVILGRGKGKNWWCVLYPPLCLLDPEAPAFKKDQSVPTQVEYKLAVLEELVKGKDLSMNSFWKGWGRFFELISCPQ